MSRLDYLVLFVISEINALFILFLFFTLRAEIPDVHSTLAGVQWGIFILSPVATFLFLRFFTRWSSLVQFSKFCVISFSNLMIDFGILNLLIYYSGVAEGVLYSVFKAASFLLANVNGYAWNKFWTFRSREVEGWLKQFIRFFAVVGVGLVINVTVASYVVAEFGGSGGSISSTLWANIGAAVSLVFTLFWNFFGLKYLVFEKRS
jgi:putative flippase GtrA